MVANLEKPPTLNFHLDHINQTRALAKGQPWTVFCLRLNICSVYSTVDVDAFLTGKNSAVGKSSCSQIAWSKDLAVDNAKITPERDIVTVVGHLHGRRSHDSSISWS